MESPSGDGSGAGPRKRRRVKGCSGGEGNVQAAQGNRDHADTRAGCIAGREITPAPRTAAKNPGGLESHDARTSVGCNVVDSSLSSPRLAESAMGGRRHESLFTEPRGLRAVLDGAKASQRQEAGATQNVFRAGQGPSPWVSGREHPDTVRTWLADLRGRRDRGGRPVANEAQLRAITVVAERTIQEMEKGSGDVGSRGEPFRRLLHGRPGTGKTYVITLLCELFAELGWEQGVHYQVVTFQASSAQRIGGDTIHHSLGIAAGKKGAGDDNGRTSQQTIAKRVSRWRWLIIDDISMVSAQLLADVDIKLRSAIRGVVPSQGKNPDGTRPFGGLNVLFCGDFWQFRPLVPGFLANIPV